MDIVMVDGREIELDDDGYLVDFDAWGEDVAKTLAEIDNVELSDCHWTAINFMREFYGEYEVPPSVQVIIKAVGDQIDRRGCTNKSIERLFPRGGCKHACRLAGLPESFCAAC